MINIRNIPMDQVESADRKTLPEPLIARIKAFAGILREVDPAPLSEILDDFSRDQHPEEEIRIWEGVARLYQKQVSDHPHLTLEEKKAVFSKMLAASLGPK